MVVPVHGRRQARAVLTTKLRRCASRPSRPTVARLSHIRVSVPTLEATALIEELALWVATQYPTVVPKSYTRLPVQLVGPVTDLAHIQRTIPAPHTHPLVENTHGIAAQRPPHQPKIHTALSAEFRPVTILHTTDKPVPTKIDIHRGRSGRSLIRQRHSAAAIAAAVVPGNMRRGLGIRRAAHDRRGDHAGEQDAGDRAGSRLARSSRVDGGRQVDFRRCARFSNH